MAIKVFADTESEKVLINQMVLDDSILDDVIVKAPIESFYNPAYRACYQAILNISGRKEKVDIVSFFTECRTNRLASNETLTEVTNAVTSAINWSFYADNVMKCYQARQLQKILSERREIITKDNVEEIVSEISAEMDNIANLSNDVIEKSQKDIMIELVPEVEKMITDPKSMMGYTTGLVAFDTITMGIHKEFIMICARPSMGKTFLAQQIALKVAEKHKVAFIELEMSAKQINFRNIAILAKIRMNDIMYGTIRNDKMKLQRVQDAMDNLALGIGRNYRVVEPISRKLSSITSYIRRVVKREGVEIVFIDHVGLIQSDNRYNSAWECAREVSNGLQKIQRELNIALVVLSQRSRSSEGGQNKGDLSTIRGSGAYEEDADVIITIEHARATDSEEKNKLGAEAEKIETELYVAKNRNGTCGIGKCVFMSSYGRFVDNLNNNT